MKTYLLISLINIFTLSISVAQSTKPWPHEIKIEALKKDQLNNLFARKTLLIKTIKSDDLTDKVLTQQENCHMTAVAFNELSVNSKEKVIRKDLENQINDEDQKSILNIIQTDNEHLMAQHKVGAEIISLNSEIIKSAVSQVPIFGKISGYGINKLNNYLIEESLSSVKTDLKNRLANYKKNYGTTSYNILIKSFDDSNPRAFLNSMNKALKPVMEDYLKDLPEEERSIVQHFYTTQAVNVLKGGIAVLTEKTTVQKGEIIQAQKNIALLGKAFYDGMEKNAEKMNEIIDMQKEIQSDVEGFKNATNQKFDFVFDFMYSRMSTTERMSAIENNILNMSEEQRAIEYKKLSVLAKQEKLQGLVDNFVGMGGEVMNIANNLHFLDPKIKQKAGQIFEVAKIGQAAFKAFSSGNMLEAASTISNLFGLGGPDIGQQRHEEIMKSFDRVFDRFDLVDERLKALLSGQEQILKNQETTYKKLIELSQEVSQNHLEVMDKLREIQGDVILNRMVMMSGIRSDYSNCLTFSDIVSTDKNIIPSFKSFDKWWVSHSSASGSCETRYINIYDVIGEKDFLPQFRIDANENSQNYEQKKVLIEAYTLSLKIIAAMIEKNDILKPGLTEAAVFFPARRMSDWDTKIRTINFLQEADLPKYKLKPYPVEPNIVSFHCKNLLNFHLYFLLMNPYTKSPYNFSDFMDPGKNHSEKGRNALIDALDLINQAIAQQNLYSGDILFSLVDEIITKHDTTKSQLYNDALKLININSLMTRNFLTYKFRKDLLAGGDKNFTAYMMAKNLAERDGDFSPLQSLVSYPWEFVLTEKSIVGSNDEGVKTKEASIKLGNRQYVLPSVSDLKDNKIEQTPDFENLLVIREGIYRELASYDVYKRFDNKQIKSLNAMMIYK